MIHFDNPLILSVMGLHMVSNKIFIIILSLFIISGCGLGDYAKPLVNDYYYNDFGRKFITHKPNEGDELVVVDSEVVSYQLENDLLLASQAPGMLEGENAQLVFWLIDTSSGETLKFKNEETFMITAKSKGLSISVIEKITH